MRPHPLNIALILGCCLIQQFNISSLAASSGGISQTGNFHSDDAISHFLDGSESATTRANLLTIEDAIEKQITAGQSNQLTPDTLAFQITKLATAGWYADDKRELLNKYETDITWLKDASKEEAFITALALARLEVARGNTQTATKFIDFVDNSPAPSFGKNEELLLYALFNITATAIAAKEKNPSDKRLDGAATLIDKVFADYPLTGEYFFSAAAHCHERKMETLSAAFARAAVRNWQEELRTTLSSKSFPKRKIANGPRTKENSYLNQLYFPGAAGEPYIQALKLLAETDTSNREFGLAAQDWMELKRFTSQFSSDDTKALLECDRNYQQTLKLAGEKKSLPSTESGAEGNDKKSKLAAKQDGNDPIRLNRETLSALHREDFESAEKMAKRVIELNKGTADDAYEATQQAQLNLFNSYWGQGKFDEAQKIASSLESQLLDGEIQGSNQVEVLLCCGKIHRIYKEEERAYNLLRKAIELREDPSCVSSIPMSILLWQAAVVVEQSEKLHKGWLHISTGDALMQEAGVLFDQQDRTIGEKQTARFYADLARRQHSGDLQVKDWLQSVEWSKRAYGEHDCHTINYKRQLGDARFIAKNLGTLRGGRISLEVPCSDIDEPKPLDSKSESHAIAH
ncbi:MAG TPA: hypothetical protein V6C97_03915 [Oculatellaceae cyanobacterium]